MLKEVLWRIFEDTGCINSYIFYREIDERNNAKDQRVMAEAEAATGLS